MLVPRIFGILVIFQLAWTSSLDMDEDQEVLCDDVICDENDCPESLDCEFGEVPDVCECCYTCAKGPGESCGGMFNLAGICTWGLSCLPHPKYPQMPGVCVEY